MGNDVLIWIWLGLAVVLAVLEAATAQLVCIWFVLGSVASMITAFFGGGIELQIGIFVAVSAVTLILTRPLAVKRLTPKKQAMNADRYLGQTGIVLEDIDNIEGRGLVKVLGIEWTARSQNDDLIPAGSRVKVLKIDGAKLIVEIEKNI